MAVAPLPIDAVLPELREALHHHGALVLEAPPGSGKTTRVPPAVAEIVAGQVIVLEPRRIAARASAARVAAERGETLGGHVGYAVRFDRREGPETRVLYVTEALLTRRIAQDPWLHGVGAVILDEFHERSLHTDLALALLAGLRRDRPDLKLVVMSATLDADAVAGWLGCPRIRAGTRMWPVEVDYLTRADDRPIAELAAAAVRAELARASGSLLVFLPGAGEIQRCMELLGGSGGQGRSGDALSRDGRAVPILPLHGELDAARQDLALRPSLDGRPRVILTTNVAETSLTVPDVTTVIDGGLARIPGHDPWAGLATLELTPISRASADQRAGRAGRTGPGRCLRLYTRSSFEQRPAETPPELRRVELAGLLLDFFTRARRPDEPLEPTWFEPPAPAAWAAARALLQRLGAIDPAGQPTPIGAAMARLPLAPRLSRVLVAAAAAGLAAPGAALVVRLGDARRGRGGPAPVQDPVVETEHGRLSEPAMQEQRQLLGLLQGGASTRASRPEALHTALSRALLTGFPDRTGQRRSPGSIVFAEGGSGEIDPATPGTVGDVVVVSGVERIGGRVRVRAMTTIPADWLVDEAEVRTTMTWTGSRVEVRDQLVYGAIVLDDSVGTGEPEAVAALLAEYALPAAGRVFPDVERAENLVERVRFLRRSGVWSDGEGPPAFDLADLVRAACVGARALDDLARRPLLSVAPLGAHADLVARLAPESLPIGPRRSAPITWPPDQAPYVASRLQDFFGLTRSPTVARGVPLVLHLLAPNGRPVQVTTDLAGFWQRHYPSIRKELMRRYPRHAWPENPTQGA